MTIRARENVSLLNANNVAFFFTNEFISDMDFLINEMLIDNDHFDNCECEVCINNEWSNSNRAKAGK